LADSQAARSANTAGEPAYKLMHMTKPPVVKLAAFLISDILTRPEF
jgi:hypothetical protein